ncbi:hypothetical protein SDD30_15595 [Moorella naiadis]|uniref:hypothetical protein n=1 Tax=Moorella naiadis (nom. illeg.) TaxID=3093670 RepID=UPI003D9CA99D
MPGRGIGLSATEKMMLALAAMAAMAALAGGYYYFIAGLGAGSLTSFLMLRWQVAAAHNPRNLDPLRALNVLMFRSLVRTGVALTLLALSAVLQGLETLFGVLTGLVLQVAAHMGQAALIILRKGGKNVGSARSGRNYDTRPPG